MAYQRVYQGKVIKRTKRIGDSIHVIFQSTVRGQPGERLVLPLSVYLKERASREKTEKSISPEQERTAVGRPPRPLGTPS